MSGEVGTEPSGGPPEQGPRSRCLPVTLGFCFSAFTSQAAAVMHLPATIGEDACLAWAPAARWGGSGGAATPHCRPRLRSCAEAELSLSELLAADFRFLPAQQTTLFPKAVWEEP